MGLDLNAGEVNVTPAVGSDENKLFHLIQCDRCDIKLIVGTRWHCADCPPYIAVDFFEQCVDCGYETKTHNSSHRLNPKRVTDSSTCMDSDYIGFMPGGACTGYNYLDPNYMPAS